jgi:hypothetical protein
MITAATKSPIFYYILKALGSMYFPAASEWNEPLTDYQMLLFHRDVSQVLQNQIPQQ